MDPPENRRWSRDLSESVIPLLRTFIFIFIFPISQDIEGHVLLYAAFAVLYSGLVPG